MSSPTSDYPYYSQHRSPYDGGQTAPKQTAVSKTDVLSNRAKKIALEANTHLDHLSQVVFNKKTECLAQLRALDKNLIKGGLAGLGIGFASPLFNSPGFQYLNATVCFVAAIALADSSKDIKHLGLGSVAGIAFLHLMLH